MDTLAALGRSSLDGASALELMREAVDLLTNRLDIVHASVLERLAGETDLRVRAAAGTLQGEIGTRVPSEDGGYVAFVLASEGPVVVDDLRTEARFTPSPVLLEHGVVSSVAVRICTMSGKPAFGLIGAHSTEPARFSEGDAQLVQGVADALAAAISRQRTARDLHDDVLQRLVVARYALDRGDHELVRSTLDAALESTREIADFLGASAEPGDLRRERPAE